MSYFSFEERFEQSSTDQGWQRLERCRSRFSNQQCAVKKYFTGDLGSAALTSWSSAPWDVQAQVLQDSRNFAVPRVPDLVESLGARGGMQHCIVTEYLEGSTLASLAPRNVQGGVWPDLCWEQHVQRLAVQLIETVGALHLNTQYAHLNITSDSVFLLDQPKQAWDDIRLTDFEFAQSDPYAAWDNKLDVQPDGVSSSWGAPELVWRTLAWQEHIRQSEDKTFEGPAAINGAAADMWSCGAVVYNLLTGRQPFGAAAAQPGLRFCSNLADSRAELHVVMTQHASWAQALAEGKDCPMLQRLRCCSATPDLAVDFFTRVFCPDPNKRLGADALFHPYLKAVTAQMTADLGRQLIVPSATVPVSDGQCEGDVPAKQGAAVEPGFERAAHHDLDDNSEAFVADLPAIVDGMGSMLDVSVAGRSSIDPIPSTAGAEAPHIPAAFEEEGQTAGQIDTDRMEDDGQEAPARCGFFKKVFRKAKAAVGFCLRVVRSLHLAF